MAGLSDLAGAAGADFAHGECRCCQEPLAVCAGEMACPSLPEPALYYAQCYDHHGTELYLDILFLTDEGPVMFGTRWATLTNGKKGVALVQPGTDFGPTASLHRLRREEALAHPLLDACWLIFDQVVVKNPTVRAHLYGSPAYLVGDEWTLVRADEAIAALYLEDLTNGVVTGPVVSDIECEALASLVKTESDLTVLSPEGQAFTDFSLRIAGEEFELVLQP